MAILTPPTWKGSFVIEEDVQQVVQFNEWGVASATIHLRGPWADCPSAVMQMTTHPDYSWLKRKTGTISREEAFLGRIVVNYEGIPPETDERYYKLRAATNSEPIETHPKFANFATAGNGAIFEEGKFTGWESVIDGEANPFAGMKSWLVPGMVYEEKWVRGKSSHEGREASKVGKVDDPPKSSARISIDGRDWLLLGVDVELVGDGSVMTRQWKLSGPSGWNPEVYDYD